MFGSAQTASALADCRSAGIARDQSFGAPIMSADLAAAIDQAWEDRADITPASSEIREAVEEALELLDAGRARVAEPDANGGWQVNQWLKKAVLLSFRLSDNVVMDGGSGGAPA